MLQIFLAILGITTAATIGFVILEQISVQQIVQDQGENIRRLNVAADGVQGALGRMPGVDALLAPVGANAAGVGWTVLPGSLGAANSTVSGVPFLYCPVASLSADALAATGAASNSAIQMPGSSYNIKLQGGFVVSSGLSIDPQVQSIFNPVAFIVAAGNRETTPPDCGEIRVVNNRAVVDNGIVRVVSMPSGVATAGNALDSAAEFWVANGASGNGLSSSNPSSIDSALQHFIRYKPAAMSIHLIDTVYPTPTIWSNFVQASASSGSKFRLLGNGTGSLNIAAGSTWDVPTTTIFDNVRISGPKIVVGSGDTVHNIGNVTYQPFGGPEAAVEVRQGGSFSAVSATIQIINPSNSGIGAIGGSIYLGGSSITFPSQLGYVIGLGPSSKLNVVQSSIGQNGQRPSIASIYSNGAAEIVSDSSSSAFGTSGGACWFSAGNNAEAAGAPYPNDDDIAFKWSLNGNGSSSKVQDESQFPLVSLAPDSSNAVAVALYQSGVNERARARRINASNIVCY